jgi:membrane protein DedA with SNARE-associated domain
MSMLTDKTMPIVVAALAGSLVGVLLGLWLGARGEQAALVELITRAELTPQCRAELDQSMKAIIEDWEGPPDQSP